MHDVFVIGSVVQTGIVRPWLRCGGPPTDVHVWDILRGYLGCTMSVHDMCTHETRLIYIS